MDKGWLVSCALLAVGACHAAREAADAPSTPLDAGSDGPRARAADRVDAASRVEPPTGDADTELTFARATAMLVVREEPLPLGHGGELLGPCVDWTRRVQRAVYDEDPDTAEAGAPDEARATLVPAERISGALFDLDGDGHDDVSVFVGAVDVTTTSEAYVVRGACGYSVGLFESLTEVKILRHASHGLFDVATTETWPPLTGKTYEVTYRFDGRAYRVISRRRTRVRDPRVDETGL